MSLRDSILNSQDLATVTVDIPRWGTITLRELSGSQREDLEKLLQQFQTKPQATKFVRATAAVMSIVENDKLVFKTEDAAALADKSGVALDAVFDKILSLNAMDKKAAAELAKN